MSRAPLIAAVAALAAAVLAGCVGGGEGEPGPTEITKVPSPDGTKVVWAEYEDDGVASRGLFVANADGTGERQLTRKSDTHPTWSPDGETIAFERADEDTGLTGSVYTIDPDRGQARQLVAEGEWPAWSPDGKRIAYGKPFGEILGIRDLERRRTTRIPIDVDAITDIVWSPDGATIALAGSARDTGASGYTFLVDALEVYAVAVDGSSVRRLTRNAAADWPRRWTEDGRIVYATWEDEPDPVEYVIASDGTERARLP